MSNTIEIPAETAETMARYVATADPILAKSAAFDAAIPGAVDLMVSRGLINPDARDVKLAEFVKDPTKLLAMMPKLASAPASLGRGANPPGAPKSGKSAADEAYERHITS